MTLRNGFGDITDQDAQTDNFSRRLRYELSEDSAIKAVEFDYNIRSAHGVPCSIIIEPSDDIDETFFWKKMHAVAEDLNRIPDRLDVMPSELRSSQNFSHVDLNGKTVDFGNDASYPNFRGNHVVAGGDKAYIDSISHENALPVISKFLRGLAEKSHIRGVAPIITLEHADDAFRNLSVQIRGAQQDIRSDVGTSARSISGELDSDLSL